jgi:hypothetical protein
MPDEAENRGVLPACSVAGDLRSVAVAAGHRHPAGTPMSPARAIKRQGQSAWRHAARRRERDDRHRGVVFAATDLPPPIRGRLTRSVTLTALARHGRHAGRGSLPRWFATLAAGSYG